MNNQEIQDKIKRLKEWKAQEQRDLENCQNLGQAHQDKIDALEAQILGLENHLKEQ